MPGCRRAAEEASSVFNALHLELKCRLKTFLAMYPEITVASSMKLVTSYWADEDSSRDDGRSSRDDEDPFRNDG